MDCSRSQQNMILEISDPEFQLHLQQCEECRHIYAGIHESMQMLEEEVEISDTLYDKIMNREELHFPEQKRKKDISLFLQFSTVVAAAVLLGIVLGFHADTQILFSKNQKKNEALIEFKEIHHLNVDRQRLF